MNTVTRVVKLNDGRKTVFCITTDNREIFNEEMVNKIVETIKYYLLKFPKLVIKSVIDYEEDPDCDGRYYYGEEKIVLNRHNLYNLEFDNLEYLPRLLDLKIKMDDTQKKANDTVNKLLKLGIPKDALEDYLKNECGTIVLEHGIDMSPLDDKYFEIICIRAIEEFRFVRRVIIHEIGHALGDQYGGHNCSDLQDLFEEYKGGFEDFHEFVAECFMVSEFTNKIELANKVRKLMNIE